MFSFLRENSKWLGSGALLMLLSGFGQTYFISIFAGELREEFGLSHSAWGGIYTIGTLSSAALMVWAGALADRFRVRQLGPLVLAALAVSCCAMWANTTLWLVPVVIFALRFTGQGMSTHLAAVAMSRWFVATRGRALAIASLGFSVGEGLLPMICVALMAVVDWRLIWLGGAMLALMGIPLLLAFLTEERTPQSMQRDTASVGMEGRHWTRMEVLRDPLFWILVPVVAGVSAFGTVFFFQQVLFAEVKGWSHFQLTTLFPIYPVTSIFAMLLWGWALDKVGTARLMPFTLLPLIAAFAIFAMSDSMIGTLVGLIAFGITAGANATVPTAFWSEFYGTQHIGAIKSMATAVMVFGSAIGPGISGLLLDQGIGLLPQYLAYAIYFFGVTAAMAWAVPRAARKLPVTAAV